MSLTEIDSRANVFPLRKKIRKINWKCSNVKWRCSKCEDGGMLLEIPTKNKPEGSSWGGCFGEEAKFIE